MAATHAAAFTQARPWSAAEFATLAADRFCHVAGDVRSFALFRVIADETELLTIATHPEHQRSGLGRDRMDLWRLGAVALGARRAFLDVAADNAPALSLYAACGFDRCGLRRGYYARPAGPPADAVLMTRDLPPSPHP
ncbi:GNAT family N-acetyltransferase [Sedimentitalea sp. JM2-8]|uniref:GNAT family N-acetyltransferase n=2 Tax=Sedimentitalea xiamensis TaxID=3050037 RepID=A0ABT7FEK7_9RHOB|nr:GNAT family N-acetyltransferase [Sedimentitalea xiamensis]